MFKTPIDIVSKFSLLLLFFLTSNIYAQWTKITTIPPPYTDNYWLEVYFLPSDPNYGWICGYNGYILRTSDGGKTWKGTQILTGGQLESIMFVDKNIGYTSGVNIYSRGSIFKSTDGGASWREITDPRRRDILWGNYFINKDVGFVVGGGCWDTPQQFFKTIDGGNNWDLVEYTAANSGLTDVTMLSKDTVYATSSGMIWKSVNGGQSWYQFSNSGGRDWQEDLHIYKRSILVPYSTGCGGESNDGGIRMSRDMGVTWTDKYTGYPMFGSFLIDDKRGWACGWAKSIYYTSNGGLSWDLKNCGIDPGVSLDDLWFINDTTGFVVGQGVYKYAPLKKEKAKITSSGLTACEGDSIILELAGNYNYYNWSTGETTKRIYVTKSGVYSAFAFNSICDTVAPDSIQVVFSPKPAFTLDASPKTEFCEGDSITLSANAVNCTFRWSTGDSTNSIVVKKGGTYTITVTNNLGCKSEKSLQITMLPLPKPKLNITGKKVFCIGDTTLIYLTENYSKVTWFETGKGKIAENVNQYLASQSGDYSALVETAAGCIGISDTINISVRADTNQLMISYPLRTDFKLDSAHFGESVCKEVVLINTKSKSLIINLPYVFRNTSFSIPQSQLPLVIQPYDSVRLKICYSPLNIGVERDTIEFFDLCSSHFLPLVAKGLKNVYSSTTVCGSDLTAITQKYPKNYQFSTGRPFPVPATNIITVPFEKISSPNDVVTENAELRDVLGTKIMSGLPVILNTSNQEDKSTITGNFIFHTSELTSGVYFITIKTANGFNSHKILINN